MSPIPRIREASRSGWKGSERVGLFADAQEFDRHTGDRADADGRSTSRVAIHLGQDQSGEPHTFVELFGHAHGILTRHRIGHEQNLMRGRGLLNRFQLGHHLVVNVQATGCI